MVLRRTVLSCLPAVVAGLATPADLLALPAAGWRARWQGGRPMLDIQTGSGNTVRALVASASGLWGVEALGNRLGAQRSTGARMAAPRSAWPAVAGHSGLPAPLGGSQPPSLTYMAVGPAEQAWLDGAELVLGAPWLAGRCWTLDARDGTFALGTPPAAGKAATWALAMHRDSGLSTTDVQVAGEPLILLFDTAAAAFATPAAQRAAAARSGGAALPVSVGQISESIAARWRSAHPDWLWLDAADRHTQGAWIQVPAVQMAGLSSGPVWFSVTPERTLQDLSTQVGRPVAGRLPMAALGGWRVTLDMANARLHLAT